MICWENINGNCQNACFTEPIPLDWCKYNIFLTTWFRYSFMGHQTVQSWVFCFLSSAWRMAFISAGLGVVELRRWRDQLWAECGFRVVFAFRDAKSQQPIMLAIFIFRKANTILFSIADAELHLSITWVLSYPTVNRQTPTACNHWTSCFQLSSSTSSTTHFPAVMKAILQAGGKGTKY